MYYFSRCKIQIISILYLICSYIQVPGQELQLVWADEFEGSSINEEYWSYEIGPTNDNIHYYTKRQENAQIKNGVLQIIALKESYEGYNYTSAHLSTKKELSWKYGRFEARIKLPGSKGFVPAFWMLPPDNQYGWWPYSGEIDIMEYPSNEMDKIYGTVHTEAYNLFGGPFPPEGDNTQVADVESAFHTYAIEWTSEKIDFFVDDLKYYTFTNDGGASDTWPFNKPFYLIMNLAVGGAWVGEPTPESIFPAIMEVDYVRVYQYPENMAINGSDYAFAAGPSQNYIAPTLSGQTYSWSVPNKARILSGQNTPSIEVAWGIFDGNVEVEMNSSLLKFPVEVSSNLLKNGGLENGVKYWNKIGFYPADARFLLSDADAHSGNYSVFIEVVTPGTNTWDIQLSQTDLLLTDGIQYSVSFWGKSTSGSGNIVASIIHPENFSLYGQASFNLTDTWKQYVFDFTASENTHASFNIDLGDHAGSYYFDDFQLTPPETEAINLVQNARFDANQDAWDFNVFSSAIAEWEVAGDAFHAYITNGGSNVWDINLVQNNIKLEQGEEYSVSFDAHASAIRDISALVGQNEEPWTSYSGENVFQLSSRRQTFNYDFKMNDPSDSQARLAFDLGANTEDVVIDNVFLANKSLLPSAYQSSKLDAVHNEILQCYPNPLSTHTYIALFVSESADVHLELFSDRGQYIETLHQGKMKEGKYLILWQANESISSGLYFIKLTTKQSTIVKRILVMR